MERYHGVGYIKTAVLFLLISLSIMLIANGSANAGLQQYSPQDPCAFCHGMPPLDSASDRDPLTGAFQGNHQKHLPASAADTACNKCHGNSGYTTSHRDGKIQLNANIHNSTPAGQYIKNAVPVTFTNQTSLPVLGKCSNVNCHFNNDTPTWGSDAAATNCSTCHTTPPTNGSHPSASGAGKKHFYYYSSSVSAQASCAKCHPNNTTFSHATSAGRDIIVQFTTAPNTGGSYSGGAYPGYLSYPATGGTCTNLYCHSNGKGGNANVAPSWGGTLPVNCNGCHGGDRNSAAFQTMSSGRHTKHIIGYNYGCADCHAQTAASNTSIVNRAKHVNKLIDVSFNANWGGSYTNSGHAPGDTSGTCQNVYCHSNAQVQTGETQVFRNMTGSKAWFYGTSTSLGCSGCHSTGSTTTGPFVLSGKHLAHLNTTVNPTIGKALACNDCHLTGGTNLGKANHANKFINYSGLRAGGKANLAIATGVCSTVYCHSDGKGVFRSMTSANWFSSRTLNCAGCHGGSGSLAGEPVYSNTGTGTTRANNHVKHVGSASPAATCVNCHSTTTTNGTAILGGSSVHADGNITLVAGNGKSFSWTSNSKTCSNISCHFSGSAQWGDTLTCASCHNISNMSGAHLVHAGGLNLSTFTFSSINANLSSGPGTGAYYYGFGCGNCHPTDSAQHANGSVQVELNNNAALASTLRTKNGPGAGYNGVSHVCDSVYCHSDGYNAPAAANTPSWIGNFTNPDKCANCHGNSPTTGAHSAHVVGIHYDDIFSGTSGKLLSGSTGNVSHGIAGQGTTLNCNICHYRTVTFPGNDANTVCKTCHGFTAAPQGPAKINELAYHVNGNVDVWFQNIPVVTKAQVRPESFVNYTAAWGRNGGNYKNGSVSYDTAKLPLDPTMWAAGAKGQGTCSNISCHVGYTVKWNDTLTCESCHARL